MKPEPIDSHLISWGTEPDDTVRWLASHGHRGVVAAAPGVSAAGIIFDRGPGTPVQLAAIGDLLSAEDDGSVRVS